jgi:cell division protein FtsB
MKRRLRDWDLLVTRKAPPFTTVWYYGFLLRYWYLSVLAQALLAVWAWCSVIEGANGWRAYQQKKAGRRQLEIEIQQLQRDNERLERRVKGLQSDPRVQEEEAINRGYVWPRATIYRELKKSRRERGSQNPPRSAKGPAQPESRSLNEQPGAARGRLASSIPIVALAFLATFAGLAVRRCWLRRTRGLWRLPRRKIS